MRPILALLTCLLVVEAQIVLASDDIDVRSLSEGEVSPKASVTDVSWLTGRWQGDGLGGIAEEVVAPPAGGQMMGMFRHNKSDGTPNFYEFYLFVEVGDTLVLRVKHFDPELHGWEKKDEYVEFPLVAVEENAIYFDDLTYKLTEPDVLQAAVRIQNSGVAIFRLTRQRER